LLMSDWLVCQMQGIVTFECYNKCRCEIGSYQFTTLDPNLGDFFGLRLPIFRSYRRSFFRQRFGNKILKHIKRTRMLAHLVSLENEKPMEVYKQIRKELGFFDKALLEKDEVIILTKTDVIDDQKKIDKVKKEFLKLKKPVFTLSLYDDVSIKKLRDELVKLLRK